MKKKLIKLLIIFFIFILTIQIIPKYANANFEEEQISENKLAEKEIVLKNEESDETLNVDLDNTICKYDRLTNTTTIIDTKEFLSEITGNSESNGYTPLNKINNNISNFSIDANSNFFFSPNLNVSPYCYTCKIISEGGFANSTGFLVGSNLLLTCAHCVFKDKTCENFFSNWTCYPAYDNGIHSPGLSAGFDTVYYSTAYKSDNETTSNENDWALCILQNDLGNTQGWSACRAYGNDSDLNNMSIITTGYPDNGNYSGKYQYYTLGNITKVRSNYFDTDTINHAGMSGGLVAQQNNNIAIGIIKGRYGDNSTYAVRITNQIVDLIKELQ